MIFRKVITIFVPSLTSALNIKTAMGDNIITMIKTCMQWFRLLSGLLVLTLPQLAF